MKLIFFKKIFAGLIAGAIACILMLLLFSAVLSKQKDPNELMSVFSLIPLIAGALVCGKIATLGLDSRALQGLIAGVFFTVAVLLPSVLVSDFDSMSLVKMLITLVCCFAGATVYKKGNTKSASSKARKNVLKRYSR